MLFGAEKDPEQFAAARRQRTERSFVRTGANCSRSISGSKAGFSNDFRPSVTDLWSL